MPQVYPFNAIQYRHGNGDLSDVVAPPYDVLDKPAKDRLVHRNPRNVVAVDLPHTPPKELGPPETYAAAGDTFRAWLAEEVLARREKPALFACRQSFTFNGKTHERCGMACTVGLVPFGPRKGGGVLPHEETFSGPKEDRFALMKATRCQLSPIFGLHGDDKGDATGLARMVMSRGNPAITATTDDAVKHEVWPIDDPAMIAAYQRALADEDVFIADGHHRYTTQLNYLKLLESQGPVPPNHPARRCMMVLVSMSDPGLVIAPTHRVLGGMSGYSMDRFTQAAKGLLTVKPAPGDARHLEVEMERQAKEAPGRNVLGLIDIPTGKCFTATFNDADPLARRYATKPQAWRTLDVALVQFAIVEEIAQPMLNDGQPVKWAFPHSVPEILEIAKGHETGAGGGKGFAQLAVVVRPTPLATVRAVSKAGELMPQKSTFFYPKLATGLFLNSLE
ncbi:MAG: DUF1015 domain-containing protein [Phycisphaerae bacterium]|nr:DUF1015 domain-containing protein [Phycisphaerae bacterium]